MIKRVFGLLLLFLSLNACNKDNEETLYPKPIDTNNQSGNDSVCFTTQILPMFVSNCGQAPGCHGLVDPSGEAPQLNNYDQIIGSLSEVMDAIVKTNMERMPPPPYAPLDSASLNLVKKWVAEGAKNSNCEIGNCDTLNISFSKHIAPVVSVYCKGCHNPSNLGGGIDLSDYTGLASVAGNGRLMGSIKQVSPYSAMPKGGKLDDCKIKQIQIWVEKGYPNN
jgi:hypothetical protein